MSNEIAIKALNLARVALVGMVLVALYCIGGDVAGADLLKSALARSSP